MFAMFWGELAPVVGSGMDGLSEDVVTSMFLQALPIFIILILVNLALSVFAFIVVWWYLGQKARSKWFLLLVIVPGALAGIVRDSNLIISLLISLVSLVCIIILYRLENRAIGYGGDFVSEPVTDRWPDTGQFNVPGNNWQPKELEYRDVSVASEKAPPEAPAEAKVMIERTSSQWTVKKPILLDDVGVVIKCFYHPDGDAVNSCSRCGQYVCSECDYVTGTHPICRNCWGKRSGGPGLAVAASTQKSVGLGKSEKRKAEESEWFREFMLLYEQALPVISIVIKKGEDGLPASPLDLMEGLKLRPVLDHVQNLSEPKQKELQEAKKEFEQVLSNCIKVAEAAAEFVSLGGEVTPGQADFARVIGGIEMAKGLMVVLSEKLTSLFQSQK
ncbi:MAG: hypothetical protein FJ023_01320 [Chloroflexi bacterium]|nr:hypothetical protein [Chloroflexota bacterium]